MIEIVPSRESEREISQQIRSISQDICNIKTDLAALEARLDPIVTPYYESESDCSIDEPGDSSPRSAIANSLDEFSCQLCAIRARISFLTDNVEI